MDLPPESSPKAAADTDPSFGAQRSEHENLRRLFVGENYPYYARNWRRMEEEKRQPFWNWAAFFLGVGWMGYRKMYRYAAIFTAIILIELILEYVFKLEAGFRQVVNIANAVVVGNQANRWYLGHVETKLRELAAPAGEIDYQQLARAGGTSVGTGFGVFGAVMVAAMLVVLILASLGTH